MGVRSPFTPTLSPLEKGGEGVGSGGDGKRDILSAPAPQSGCAEGRYRLKRKSVLGSSITLTGPLWRKKRPTAPFSLKVMGLLWERAGGDRFFLYCLALGGVHLAYGRS